METSPIKYGVCGLGRIGSKHCSFFSEDRNRYQSVAFCDIDEARASAAAEQFGGKAHTSYTEFLANPEMELVIVASSAGTPLLGGSMSAEQDLPWIEETRQVEPGTSLWTQVEIELVRHLYHAIRDGIPFPVKNADALEVVRITEMVKQQNPQFNWIG